MAGQTAFRRLAQDYGQTSTSMIDVTKYSSPFTRAPVDFMRETMNMSHPILHVYFVVCSTSSQ